MRTHTFKISLSIFVIYSLIAGSTALAESYDATISFSNKITLSLPVTGIVNQVTITRGQKITAGQILITVEQTPFKAEVAQAKSSISIHKTRKTETQRDLAHAQELYERGVLSNVSLENAKLAHERATADFNAAIARLDKANYELQHTSLVAPFEGWVLAVHTRNKESINNRVKVTPLLTIAEANKYIATTSVPLEKLTSIKAGQSMEIEIANQHYAGKLASSSLEPENEKTGTDARYEIDVMFFAKELIYAGQTAKLTLP